MDEELDAIFTAEIDEEFGDLPGSEQPGTIQNHDAFFSNRFGVVVPEDDGKKGNSCINCLKGIWATRNKEILQDKETIIKTTVRELLIYTGFIIIILTIALLPTVYLQTYFFTDIVQKVTFASDSSNEEAFTKIHDRPSMWNFILSSFLTSLYNGNAGSRLVGCPRIRQVRVSNVNCRLPNSVPDHLRHCFPTFSSELENRDPIVPAVNKSVVLSKLAWHWRSASESKSDRVVGTIATYTGSGYYLDLGQTHQTTLDMLIELYTNLWTSESTRAVIIDFTLYNANLNFFCVVQ